MSAQCTSKIGTKNGGAQCKSNDTLVLTTIEGFPT
jgi:hypothetical protein